MKIGFHNFTSQSGHKTRGIGYYAKHLLEEFKKNQNIEIQEFLHIDEVKEADLIHYPYFDLFQTTLPIKKRYPTVVTIHDLTPLIFPKHYPPGIKGRINYYQQFLSLRNVKAIITDSLSSKKDIVKILKIKPQIVFPIYLAVDEKCHRVTNKLVLNKIQTKYYLPKDFVIYIGDVNWNKNLINLTEASLKSGINIVFVGKGFEQRNQLNHPELASFKIFLNRYKDHPNIHILGYIPEEDKNSLLSLAKVLLLPSYYEGFGLTILEAQSCGVPVVTSQVSSMPEIAGKGAILVNPEDVDNISQAINRIIKNKTLRENLIEEGFKNIKRFSWLETANQTYQVYKYAIEK